MDRGRSARRPARHVRQAEARQPARRRPERAPPELREPAVRHRRRCSCDENLWPEGHGYHWPTIGLAADLKAATPDDVSAFFKQYYVPNNADDGDRRRRQGREREALVEKYFAWIPRGAEVERPQYATPPPITKEIVVDTTDDVQVPRVYLVVARARPRSAPTSPRARPRRGDARRRQDEPALQAARLRREDRAGRRGVLVRRGARRHVRDRRDREARRRSEAPREGDRRGGRQAREPGSRRRRGRTRAGTSHEAGLPPRARVGAPIGRSSSRPMPCRPRIRRSSARTSLAIAPSRPRRSRPPPRSTWRRRRA